MMKMSELILAIGDDNSEFQNRDQCAEKLNMNGGATRITFATLRNITPQGTDKLGLVLWLDRDAVKAARRGGRAAPLRPQAMNAQENREPAHQAEHALSRTLRREQHTQQPKPAE